MKKVGVAIFIILILSSVVWKVQVYKNSSENSHLQITFFNVGQGDSALIHFRNGQKMLVDCGPDKKVMQKLGKYLNGTDQIIDYMLITHFDLDHYGGCVDVLKRYDVKHVVTNGYTKPNDSYWIAWNEAAQNEHAEFKVINQVETWSIASTTLEIISPNATQIYKPSDDTGNNHSIVFRLNDPIQHLSVLFTGDIEEPTEKLLVDQFCVEKKFDCPILKAKILKAAHHGSDTSSSNDFVEAVHPEKVIISVGKFNKFGHPSLRVLRRLERLPTQILRTDLNDDIILN
jgi:competence protein ComEC